MPGYSEQHSSIIGSRNQDGGFSGKKRPVHNQVNTWLGEISWGRPGSSIDWIRSLKTSALITTRARDLKLFPGKLVLHPHSGSFPEVFSSEVTGK